MAARDGFSVAATCGPWRRSRWRVAFSLPRRSGACWWRSIATARGRAGFLRAARSPPIRRRRVGFMLADSGAPAWVATNDRRLADRLPRERGRASSGSGRRFRTRAGGPNAPAVPGRFSAGNLAYVIYTSARTGSPKGRRWRSRHRSAVGR